VIAKRGHSYWLDFRIGKKRYRRSLGTDQHGLALDRAREIKSKLLQANARSDITFADFKAKYLEWAWQNKPASADREEQRLGKIAAFFGGIGIQYLADITPWHIEQLKAHLKDLGRSPATANRYLQLLRGMFYRAIDWELYGGTNPVKKVRFFRESPERRLLSADELQKIINCAKEISAAPASPLQRVFHDMIILALHTGLRKSEILRLSRHDLTPDGLRVIGKGNRVRTVPLNKTAQTVIGRQPRRSEFIFYVPNRDKGGLMRRTTALISKRTGIPFHLHLLRHRFTSTLLEHGIDLVTVSELLGHSKTMTSLIYSHTDPARKQHAVDTLMDTGKGMFSKRKR
jgi:integrase